MSRRRTVARPLAVALTTAAATSVAAASPAGAQGGDPSPTCTALPVPGRDACQKSLDLFNYFAPQLGALVAGGNIELGRGGALGGIGHFSLGARVNGFRSPVPQLQDVRLSPLGAQRSTVRTDPTWVGFPVADLAVGLFNGVALGVTRVGGVDALVNASYLPNVTTGDVAVRTTGGALRLGFGARVGLLQENALVPGVAVSVIRRELPTVSFDVTTAQGDRFGVRDARVRSDAWRITASKNFLLFSLTAGYGEDRYRMGAGLAATVGGAFGLPGAVTVSGLGASQRLTRRNYFADFTLLRLPVAQLVGEIGRTEGGSLPATYNDFGGRRPDQGFTYGSVGVRVGR